MIPNRWREMIRRTTLPLSICRWWMAISIPTAFTPFGTCFAFLVVVIIWMEIDNPKMIHLHSPSTSKSLSCSNSTSKWSPPPCRLKDDEEHFCVLPVSVLTQSLLLFGDYTHDQKYQYHQQHPGETITSHEWVVVSTPRGTCYRTWGSTKGNHYDTVGH